MKKVEKKEVEHIALLSRLTFSDKEKEAMGVHLTSVTKQFETLDMVNTDGIEPMAHLLNKVNVLREDIPNQITPRAVLLERAPQTDDSCYVVPKVLE